MIKASFSVMPTLIGKPDQDQVISSPAIARRLIDITVKRIKLDNH